MKVRQMFLVIAAIGLVPVALSYGVAPKESLSYLFDIAVSNRNGAHIFRATMGLYMALAIFWIIGAFRARVSQAALYSLIVFMFGLAAGRILSIVVDGVPHWLLVAYLAMELLFGILGVLLLKKQIKDPA